MTPEELADAGLRYAVSGAVATVTLSRPEVRNAQTPAMWRALAAIGDQVADDVGVVAVRGDGPSFSAGLDRALLDPRSAHDPESVVGLLARPGDEVLAVIGGLPDGVSSVRDTTRLT